MIKRENYVECTWEVFGGFLSPDFQTETQWGMDSACTCSVVHYRRIQTLGNADLT